MVNARASTSGPSTLRRRTLGWLAAGAAAPLLAACATAREPLHASVVRVERLDATATELRLQVTLRLGNPNDVELGWSGLAAELVLNGQVIGRGQQDGGGSVPRLGERVVLLPVTVTGLGEVRRAIGLYGAADRPLDLTLRGRVFAGPMPATPFGWRGEMALPLPPHAS